MIRPKINILNPDPTLVTENKVVLEFLTLCFVYILWVDKYGTGLASSTLDSSLIFDNQLLYTDVLALSLLECFLTLTSTLPLLASSNLPQFNSGTHQENLFMFFDSKDELILSFVSLKKSFVPQFQ